MLPTTSQERIVPKAPGTFLLLAGVTTVLTVGVGVAYSFSITESLVGGIILSLIQTLFVEMLWTLKHLVPDYKVSENGN